jgi:uncharacterized protein YggU (UPF0235/DUF167 family)
VVGRYGDGWKVRIAAAPEQGRANADLCSFLASLAGIPRSDVRVVSGASGRDKLVELQGLDEAELRGMLDAASGK